MGDEPELTPEEEARFGKFFDKKLAEHAAANPPRPAPATQASSGAPASAPAPAPGASMDIGAMIQKALDDRDKSKDGESKLQQMQKDIEDLKGAHTGRKRAWFSPLFD